MLTKMGNPVNFCLSNVSNGGGIAVLSYGGAGHLKLAINRVQLPTDLDAHRN
jgi:hypothetical protein